MTPTRIIFTLLTTMTMMTMRTMPSMAFIPQHQNNKQLLQVINASRYSSLNLYNDAIVLSSLSSTNNYGYRHIHPCIPRGGGGTRNFLTSLFASSSSSSSAASTTRRKILTGVGGLFLGIPLLLEGYARSGVLTPLQEEDIKLISFSNKHGKQLYNIPNDYSANNRKGDLTILFHGANGPDENIDNLLTTIQNNHLKNEGDDALLVDWSTYSKDTLKASFDGERVGRNVATNLFASSSSSFLNEQLLRRYERIHVIGVSVGAFPAHAFIQHIRTLEEKDDNDALLSSSSGTNVKKQNKAKRAYIQLTLLDPFQLKGALSSKYGINNFGLGADYAQHYLNTDDPVPSTNEPLTNHCVCTDITSLRPTDLFGHDWPLVYYTQQEDKIGFVPANEQRERGSLLVL